MGHPHIGHREAVAEAERCRRSFSSAQVAKLAEESGGICANPFCDRLSSKYHGHHVAHYSKGGLTEVENGILLCTFCHLSAHKQILRQKLLQQIKSQTVLNPPSPSPWLKAGPANAEQLWERLEALHSSNLVLGRRLHCLDMLISEAWHLHSDRLRIEFWSLTLLDRANALSDSSRELFGTEAATASVLVRRRKAAIGFAASVAYMARPQGRYDLVARAMHARAASYNAIADYLPRRRVPALSNFREARKALEARKGLLFKRSVDDSTHYARILREAAITKARLGRGRNIIGDLERSRALECENNEHEFTDASIRLAEGLVHEGELSRAEKVLADTESTLSLQTPKVVALFLKTKGVLLDRGGDARGALSALDKGLALARKHSVFHEEHQLSRMKENIIHRPRMDSFRPKPGP